MINSSPAEYVFIRVCIFLLQAIAPISISYTLCEAVLLLAGRPPLLPLEALPLTIWLLAETGFYFAVQLPLQFSIQRDALHPPLLQDHERRELFAKITKDVGPAETERHLRWWFRGADLDTIGREGVKSWLAWAFFEGRIEGDSHEIGKELEEYTSNLESVLGQRFSKGPGTAIPIRLTLDAIHSSYRSLVWYTCVGFVDFLTYCKLCWNGYHHHRQPLSQFFALFPFRPVALTALHRSPVTHLSYWHRPHTSKKRLPVLFIHGIGIGLYPYVDFLDDLIHKVDESSVEDDGQIGIIALEIMPVAFRITHSALSKEAMCSEINVILRHHGWKDVVLVAHSYGTVVATHILHDSVLRSSISSVILVDPVCFLLHNPDVAYNFTVRLPRHANEWQLWYFASQDPGVAHTLGRRFFWSQNVLWLEELQRMIEQTGLRVTVSLAGRDLIVDTETVGKYLVQAERGADDSWKHEEWRGEGLEILWNEDKDHAQVFDKGWMRDRLVRVVRKYCESQSSA